MSPTVYVILTGKCNQQCEYCFYTQEGFRKKEDKLRLERLSGFLSQAKNRGFREITLTGGEPFLKKSLLLSVIDFAGDLGLKININTNGTLLDDKLIDDLGSRGPLNLFLPGRSIIKKLISKKKFEVLAKKFNLKIIHVITKNNLEDIQKIIDIVDKAGAELILQPAYIAKGYGQYKKLSLHELDPAGRALFAKKFTAWAKIYKKPEYRDLVLRYYATGRDTFKKPKFCHMGKNDLVVDSDGSVYPCFHLLNLKLGNIIDDSPRKIFQAAKTSCKNSQKAQCFGEHCISLFYS